MLQERINRLNSAQRGYLAARLAALSESVTPAREVQKQLVAWIVAKDDQLSDDALRSHLETRLPKTLVPRRFVRLPGLPMTTTGKVDRRQVLRFPVVVDPQPEAAEHRGSREEQILVRLCGSLLRSVAVSPTDNFFTIGGDSLMAIRLVALAKEQGLQLEAGDVYETQSLRDLAARSRSRAGSDSADGPPRVASAPCRISTLREGTAPGSVLFLNGLGGESHHAHFLVDGLCPSMTILASKQTLPADRQAPECRFEELASAYISEWKRCQPHGPRVVVGLCWGAILAYEIAQQLRRAGEDAELIVIEGGVAAAFRFAPRPNWLLDLCRGQVRRVLSKIRWIVSGRARRRRAAAGRTQDESARQQVEVEGFVFDAAAGDPELIRRNLRSSLAYEITPLMGSMHLFLGSDSHDLIARRFLNPMRGWGYLCPGGVTLHRVSGDHMSCTRPPHADVLISAMNRALQGTIEGTG